MKAKFAGEANNDTSVILLKRFPGTRALALVEFVSRYFSGYIREYLKIFQDKNTCPLVQAFSYSTKVNIISG